MSIERATSEKILAGSEDLEANLEVCEYIQSRQYSSKEALGHLKKRLLNSNPNVQMLAIQLLDTCAKNGGILFLGELSSAWFVAFLNEFVHSKTLHPTARQRILECIQMWGLGFAERPDLGNMVELYNSLVDQDIRFPPVQSVPFSLFETEIPPEWTDSLSCTRCKTPFGLTTRKHHCRNCGRPFCHDCSSRMHALPQFGITFPVRICDQCFHTLCQAKPAVPSDREDDMELAIKLSLEEQSKCKDDELDKPSRFHNMVHRASQDHNYFFHHRADLKTLFQAVYSEQAQLRKELDQAIQEYNRLAVLKRDFDSALQRYETRMFGIEEKESESEKTSLTLDVCSDNPLIEL